MATDSTDQVVRLLGGKIEYIDGVGRMISLSSDAQRGARKIQLRCILRKIRRGNMSTIVEYVDGKAAKNLYPKRIVSPGKSGPCCFSEMEMIGRPQEEGCWVFQYRRCRRCGFTVRVILRQIPDYALMAEVRKILSTSFMRKVPDY